MLSVTTEHQHKIALSRTTATCSLVLVSIGFGNRDVSHASMMAFHCSQACQGELAVGSTGLTGSANLFGAGAFTQDGQRQRSQVCTQVLSHGAVCPCSK